MGTDALPLLIAPCTVPQHDRVTMIPVIVMMMHSSRNFSVRCGSFLASVSDTDLMKMVLLLGMHSPLVSRRCPSIFMSKVEVRAQRRL